MGLHNYGNVNVPQCSNTLNYCMAIMNKMAVVIQREESAADFQAVLLFTSILKPIQHDTTLRREALADHWIQKDVSEESAEYLFLSCATTRLIVVHGMWTVLAWIVSGTATSLQD